MFTAALAFLLANATEIVTVLFALHAFAVVVVNLTPTEIDNRVLAVLHRVLIVLADFIPNTKTGKSPDR